MSNKKKRPLQSISPERDFKSSKLDFEGDKKHSLDSDEEDIEQEKKDQYRIMYDDDIEGQEEGISGMDGNIKITPFNMKEELEEGHFDTDGNFHWNKNDMLRDNWQENIDWMEVKNADWNCKEKNNLENSMDSESLSPFDQLALYKQILEYMKPGETITNTLRRLGGNKLLSASERLKRKKAGIAIEDAEGSSKVTELTELANRLLTRTGNMDIYQESYSYIKNMVDSGCGNSKYEDALDMYADDFDEKEKQRLESKSNKEVVSEKIEEGENFCKGEEILMWEYKLEKEGSKIQGPHTSEQMQKYVDEGFFKGEVWVRKVGQDGPFYSSRRIDFQLYL